MKSLLLVGMGGFIGSVARYYTQLLFHKMLPGNIPYGTLTANVLGCFVIGIIFALGLKQGMLSTEWRLFIAIGFCGGFTTFSSFSLENFLLLQSGQYMAVVIYFFSSVFLGFGATLLAVLLFR